MGGYHVEFGHLATPAFLVDLDAMEENIHSMATLCSKNGVELWPMVKTHKSLEIVKMQAEAGAEGFLTGTLDEAEQLIANGFSNIMLAYPVASPENIGRVAAMASNARVIIGLDGLEAARSLDTALQSVNRSIEYLIIIDSGLHRFGVLPEAAAELADALKGFRQLKLAGIATHPGHVYAAAGREVAGNAARDEVAALAEAKEVLEHKGFSVSIVATGSTPTALSALTSGIVTVLRPGNYVFYDNTQVALGVVAYERCALTVLTTILSHPRQDTFIIDAGSKCFGLDKGAHGSSLISSYGVVKDHPELLVTGLSEEVGKILIQGDTSLKVGDKIRIIPNHACSAANMTNWLIGCRGRDTERQIAVSMRGGSVGRLE